MFFFYIYTHIFTCSQFLSATSIILDHFTCVFFGGVCGGNMKFLLEFMGCCGSCSSTSVVKEEARLLAPAPELCRVRGRKRGRGIGASRSGRNGGGSSAGVEWRPSLSSICEDNVEYNHQEVAAVKSSAERNLKRKVRSSTPKPRSYSPQKEDSRRPAVHAVMPTFSPAPFMF